MPFSRDTAPYGLPHSDEEEEAYRRELRDAGERSRQIDEQDALFESYLVPPTSVAEMQQLWMGMRATAAQLAEEQDRYEAPPSPYTAHRTGLQNAAAAQGTHAGRPPATSFRPSEYPEADRERARQRERVAAQLRADRAIAEHEQHDLDQEGARKRHVRGGIAHNSYRDPSLTGTVQGLFEGPGMRPNAGADAAVQGLDDEDHDELSREESHDRMMIGSQSRMTVKVRRAAARLDNDATEDNPQIDLARFQQIRKDGIMAHQMLNEEYATMADDEALARAVQEKEYEAAESDTATSIVGGVDLVSTESTAPPVAATQLGHASGAVAAAFDGEGHDLPAPGESAHLRIMEGFRARIDESQRNIARTQARIDESRRRIARIKAARAQAAADYAARQEARRRAREDCKVS